MSILYIYIYKCKCTSRCVLTGDQSSAFVFSRLSFNRKKCIPRMCVPSYFIDIFLYIISYVNVHFCHTRTSAKIKLDILLYCYTVCATKGPNLYKYNRYNLHKIRFKKKKEKKRKELRVYYIINYLRTILSSIINKSIYICI